MSACSCKVVWVHAYYPDVVVEGAYTCRFSFRKIGEAKVKC